MKVLRTQHDPHRPIPVAGGRFFPQLGQIEVIGEEGRWMVPALICSECKRPSVGDPCPVCSDPRSVSCQVCRKTYLPRNDARTQVCSTPCSNVLAFMRANDLTEVPNQSEIEKMRKKKDAARKRAG